jgi:hypothetical protein
MGHRTVSTDDRRMGLLEHHRTGKRRGPELAGALAYAESA